MVVANESKGLNDYDKESRAALERKLLERQTGKCFICDDTIDLVIHKGQLEVDHIVPRSENGPDEENNFALVHLACNRQKSAADLRVARRMSQFERLQSDAVKRGERGANLGHILQKYGGASKKLVLRIGSDTVQYALADRPEVRSAPLYNDSLSGMDYFFALLPIEYLHHDDRINPRSIGSSVRDLIAEFLKKRPQLHIALGWWSADAEATGSVKVFDGQHKAAAQILLGVRQLPVRVFVNPDTNVLLAANTNAGSKLRQVAFDAAVLRHLGSTLYAERVQQYQDLKGLGRGAYGFSERDLANFFRGERREVLRYVIDAQRDSVTHNTENRLMEFVEWSGKGSDRPMSYATIDGTFFKEFVYKQVLETPIGEGIDRGDNPRQQEREQLIKLMNLFAEIFFVGQWNPDVGGNKLENRLQKGDNIAEAHLRAWRIAREEILANVLAWVRLVIENYFAWTGQQVQKDRLLHRALPEPLWVRIEFFLRRMRDLPCWVDKNLSNTVFGGKQNLDYWRLIFETGVAPSGVRVLAKPLVLTDMIQQSAAAAAD